MRPRGKCHHEGDKSDGYEYDEPLFHDATYYQPLTYMTNDHFWKSLWLLFSGAVILCTLASALLFFAHVGNIDAGAVGVDYTPDKDPFETSLHKTATSVVTGGYVYKDALPLGVSSWNWDSSIDARSTEQVYEGSAALKAVFTKEWAGFGISGFSINTAGQKTLSLAVYPDSNVGDLYVELYDNKGVSLGQQSLGWYASGAALIPNQWQIVSIPVQNFMGSSTASTVTALSINTTSPGTAYVDAVQFNNTPSDHAPWVYKAPVGYVAPPFNPFATSTAVSLPYTLVFSANYDDNWFSTRGFFEQAYDSFKIGPLKGENSDALAFFRGGKAWNDYEVSSSVIWGTTRVFALLLRVQDNSDYVSCSFSNSGDTIQMYDVVGGVSTMVAQSDKIHYSDWTGGIEGPGAIVHGNTLTCSLDGKQYLSHDISDIPAQGSVGMEAWDQDDTLTAHQIKSFTVVPLAGE